MKFEIPCQYKDTHNCTNICERASQGKLATCFDCKKRIKREYTAKNRENMLKKSA